MKTESVDPHLDCVPWRIALIAMAKVRRSEGAQQDYTEANIRILEKVLDDDKIAQSVKRANREYGEVE